MTKNRKEPVLRDRKAYTSVTTYLDNKLLAILDRSLPWDSQKKEFWSRNRYLNWILRSFIESLPMTKEAAAKAREQQKIRDDQIQK